MPLAAASALLLFLFTGCQGIEDQIGKTIAEKAIEGATGGSMQVNTETGEMKIKTPEGEVKVTGNDDQYMITTPEGEAVFGGGDTRPASVQDDLPNLEGAADFSWAGSQEGGMFSFTVKGIDHKQTCESEIGLLEGKGWKLDEETLMEFEGMMNRSLAKEGYSLSLSCSADKEENTVTVVMIKSKNTP
jgi:hypothetical protein